MPRQAKLAWGVRIGRGNPKLLCVSCERGCHEFPLLYQKYCACPCHSQGASRSRETLKSALTRADMTDGDLTLQQVGIAPECAVAKVPAEDPFIRDEQGNPLMVKGTEAPKEAATKVANRMKHAG